MQKQTKNFLVEGFLNIHEQMRGWRRGGGGSLGEDGNQRSVSDTARHTSRHRDRALKKY